MNQISNMLDSSIENIRRLIDANTIIGNEIKINGYVIIPISNVKLNFATLGLDVMTKKENNPSSGGIGGSVSIKPSCFIACRENEIKLLSSNSELIELINMVSDKIAKND